MDPLGLAPVVAFLEMVLQEMRVLEMVWVVVEKEELVVDLEVEDLAETSLVFLCIKNGTSSD